MRSNVKIIYSKKPEQITKIVLDAVKILLEARKLSGNNNNHTEALVLILCGLKSHKTDKTAMQLTVEITGNFI